MTGRTVRLWAGLDRVHVLLDGYRIKTLPSRLDARDLSRLAAAGARRGGAAAPASGDVIEIERTVSASGNVSWATCRPGTAGQRVTLRLDGPVATSCPAGSWPEPSRAPSRRKPGPGCAEPGPG